MAIFDNGNDTSIFSSLELSDESNIAVFRLKHELDIEIAKKILTQNNQKILAESSINGDPIIIVNYSEDKDSLLHKFSTSNNDNFKPHTPEQKGFLGFLDKHGWKVRGSTSVIAQVLQIWSSFVALPNSEIAKGKTKPDKFDSSIFFFSVFNLGANAINFFFGGQKEEDKFGFRKLTGRIENEVNRHLSDDNKLELSHEKTEKNLRKTAYMEAEEAKKLQENIAGKFLAKNSVWFGEVALRVIGSFSMAFAPKNWKPAFTELMKGNFKGAYQVGKTDNPMTHLSGMGMLLGKGLGLLAKSEDPFNPAKTFFGKIREKVAWTSASTIELISTGVVINDRIRNQGIVVGGKKYPDFIGTVANVFNAAAYPVRWVLPIGVQNLDLEEVEARLIDGLLKLPANKIPEVIARVTSGIVEHLGAKSPEYTKIYSGIVNKLEKYHGISIIPPSTIESLERSYENSQNLPETTRKFSENLINPTDMQSRVLSSRENLATTSIA